MANPSPDKGNAPMEDQRTCMTDEQAERWAWEQVKRDVGTEGWTAGESCTYYGFFLWGWRYKGQYQRQRATPPSPSTAPEVDERAAFEHHEHASNLQRVGVERDGSGGWYENPCVQSAWEGWQARAALASRPAEVGDEGLPQAIEQYRLRISGSPWYDMSKTVEKTLTKTREGYEFRTLYTAPCDIFSEIFQAQVENGHWCDVEASSLSDWESMHIRTRRVLVPSSHTTNKDAHNERTE